VYVGILMALLPGVALATNYYPNDRSNNYLARDYAKNILDSCPPNAVIFTSGDNDTLPLWGVQEAYDYRKDVRVLCLSLVNTDWYVEQMKNRFGVPLSLKDDQILWDPVDMGDGRIGSRPANPFRDRPRNRETYMIPNYYDQRMVKVQDMIVDEVVIENQWKDPVCFSSPPYAESPLKLREHATSVGNIYQLEREPKQGLIDVDRSYDLFMNTYQFDGMKDSKVYRDENATGVYISLGVSAIRLFDELIKRDERDKAVKLLEHVISVYPEYWQTYFTLAGQFDKEGDSTKADKLYQQLSDTLTSFLAANPDNQVYMQDLGMTKVEIGKRKKDQALVEAGVQLLKEGFALNQNNGYAFRMYLSVLGELQRYSDMQVAARQFSEYKINLGDPYVQRLLGVAPPAGGIIEEE